MKDQDTLRNVLIAAAIFMIVMAVGPKLLPPRPEPAPQETATPQAATTGAEETSPPSQADPATPVGQPVRTAGTTAGNGFAVVEAAEELTVPIGSELLNGVVEEAEASPYRMRLVLSNVGASVESATMTDHAETINSPERYPLLSRIERDDGTIYRSLAVEKINIDDVDVPLHDKKWSVKAWNVAGETRYSTDVTEGELVGQRVEFSIDITQDGQPALRLTRRFTLPQQSKESGQHDLRSELVVENLSPDQPHTVVVTHRGVVDIPMVGTRMDDRVIDYGIRSGETGRVGGGRTQLSKVAGKKTLELFKATATAGGERLSWAASGNRYFTCVLAPVGVNWTDDASNVTELSGVDLDGLGTTDDDVTLRFVVRSETVAPGAESTNRAVLYLGKKDPDAFREIPFYSSRDYYFQVYKSYPFCTFTVLVELMIWLLNGLYSIFGDYGVAIMIMVVLVRALLHPLTKKGQVNMVRMQQRMGEFAPKIEELKKKFGNDKQKLQQETMKLYREHGINPAGQMLTCLPQLIQLPIWVALYISLWNNIMMRHEAFLFTWINDLSAPDALYTFARPIIVPLFGWELPAFNLLPILVSIFMYTQQKLQPKPKANPNASEQQRSQQEMMQKMMPMMSIMMLLIFYKMPSGLNLYIMSSSLFGTIEQWWIRKHIKKSEDDGTLHKPTGPEPDGPKRPGKFGFMRRFQQMAENAQKQAQQRSPRSPKKR